MDDAFLEAVVLILDRAWTGGFTLQSQFFRDNAVYVGLAASEGWITTIINQNKYGNIWRLTPEGAAKLFETRLYLNTKGNT